jgi:tetratricopeptide (TPR) repeat protein
MNSLIRLVLTCLLTVLSAIGSVHAAGGKDPGGASQEPVKDPALLAEVQALVDAKKYKQAEQQAIEALRVGGPDAEIYNLLGFARRKQKQWDESISAYRKALEMKPDFSQAKEYLAVAYLNSNQVAAAKALHQELAKSAPELAVMVEMEARRLKVKW